MNSENTKHKYEMKMSLNVLNHLGLNLYSNIPAVLSEVVANSYDADARKVEITLADDRIIIKDDGIGMGLDEINEKYLFVGYEKREHGEEISPIFKRKVMGRKGIGKLSIFSIADTVELHSCKNGQRNALRMNRADIQKQIKENNGTYNPEDLEPLPIDSGTTIILTDIKKRLIRTTPFLKRRLARRFTVINPDNNFSVSVNGETIGMDDREYFRKINFLWLIGGEKDRYSNKYGNIKKVNNIQGDIDVRGDNGNIEKHFISGWIGAVEYPSNLEEEGTNNNKISLMARGKMAQEDILDTFAEGGIYASYLIGEITANFLDDDDKVDIATSSRQSYNEDDPRFVAVKNKVYQILKKIQNEWTELRNEAATERILSSMPPVKKWYDELQLDKHKEQARKLFKTIDTLPFEKDRIEDKKTLVRQAILAFEQLKIKDRLEQIDKISTANDVELISVFTQLNEIEASLYYDIVTGRIAVIRELQEKIENNELEKVLQKLIFDNLWLLNPMWERATRATEYMEKTVQSAFQTTVEALTEDERNGRIDIGYRTAAGKHIIIELKRYKPSYKITPFILASQVDKYKKALEKVLNRGQDDPSPYIEVICILGEHDNNYSRKDFDAQLVPFNGRVYPYDQLINESLQSYSEYLEREKAVVGKLKALLDQI